MSFLDQSKYKSIVIFALVAIVSLLFRTYRTRMENQKTVAEQNREYWKYVGDWMLWRSLTKLLHSTGTNFYEAEKDWANKVAAQYTQELQNRREWLGLPAKKSGSYRLLDVACGPGMLSHVRILLHDP